MGFFRFFHQIRVQIVCFRRLVLVFFFPPLVSGGSSRRQTSAPASPLEMRLSPLLFLYVKLEKKALIFMSLWAEWYQFQPNLPGFSSMFKCIFCFIFLWRIIIHTCSCLWVKNQRTDVRVNCLFAFELFTSVEKLTQLTYGSVKPGKKQSSPTKISKWK